MKKTIAITALIALWLFAMWAPGQAGPKMNSLYYETFTVISSVTTTTGQTSDTYSFDSPVANFSCNLSTSGTVSILNVRIDTLPSLYSAWDTTNATVSFGVTTPVTIITKTTNTLLIQSFRSVITRNTNTDRAATLYCTGIQQ